MQIDKIAEIDKLYRVKALKIRDLERARQGSVDIQRQCDGDGKKTMTVPPPAREHGRTVTVQTIGTHLLGTGTRRQLVSESILVYGRFWVVNSGSNFDSTRDVWMILIRTKVLG